MLAQLLQKYPNFYPVVPFDWQSDNFLVLDFTENNTELKTVNLLDTEQFNNYISQKLQENKAKVGVGGYNENRFIYNRSEHFQQENEPRSIHLGIDIWAIAGTEICSPLDGIVHSFQNNETFGDYGPTIILEHEIQNQKFYTLYGHLSLESLEGKSVGQKIEKGQIFASFGNFPINGNWPPHLHFQIVENIEQNFGDYPGVCTISKRDYFLKNCPNPNLILRILNI